MLTNFYFYVRINHQLKIITLKRKGKLLWKKRKQQQLMADLVSAEHSQLRLSFSNFWEKSLGLGGGYFHRFGLVGALQYLSF